MRIPILYGAAAGIVLLAACSVVAGPPALEGYRDQMALRTAVRNLAKSKIVSCTTLTRTLGGQEVSLLTVGSGAVDEKPALLVVGGIDPARPVDGEVVLRVVEQLASKAATDPDVRRLLDRVTVYGIVQAAPDGSETFFEKPQRQRHVNSRPIDDDTDGRTDEDGPDDLNGDGLITVMRVEDADGPYIVHPKDDRVMIEADPKKGERGRYQIYVEGKDNDGDGKLNEDPPGGVAFDRNFTFDYPYFQPGAGPHQVSEIETRAIADFCYDHPNIVLVWTVCGRDNLLHPWKPDKMAEEEEGDEEERNEIKRTLLAEDAPYFNEIAKVYSEIAGDAKPPELPGGKGSFLEWAYFHYGRWSLATRPWSIPSEANEKEGSEETEKDDKNDSRGLDDSNALAWFKQRGMEGFVPWQSIQHPDLEGKKVEIGGFKPFLKDNPPAELLDGLAETQSKFLVKLLGMLPRVELAEVKAEPLGAGVWRVTAVVVNKGKLPTTSEMGRVSRQPQRLQVELKLPAGASLVTGHARRSLTPLAGEGGRAEEKWLVRVDSDKTPVFSVRAWSPMAGEASGQTP